VSDADADVVAAVRRGDVDAFGHLVRAYQRQLFGLVLMMVRVPSGAEDITQDAFVRAFRYLDRYDEARPFYPWLAAIAVRLAQNWLHQQARRTRRDSPLPHGEDFAGASAPLDDLIRDERSRRLWRDVAALPSGERTVVALFYRDELPLADIATALGVSVGTVKTLLFRARRHLRERAQSNSSEIQP
jgi:RNA polymerase sigma-70 factor, ECF subfamily